LRQIRHLISNELTIEEQKQLAEVQARLFAEPDQAIQEGILMSQTVIDRIDEKLLDPNFSEEKRMKLIPNKENIAATLRKLTLMRNDSPHRALFIK
jgi:hypothetical protein